MLPGKQIQSDSKVVNGSGGSMSITSLVLQLTQALSSTKSAQALSKTTQNATETEKTQRKTSTRDGESRSEHALLKNDENTVWDPAVEVTYLAAGTNGQRSVSCATLAAVVICSAACIAIASPPMDAQATTRRTSHVVALYGKPNRTPLRPQ